MDFTEIMKQNKGYFSRHTGVQSKLQQKAKELCWKYNQTGPSEGERRSSILKELLGTYNPLTFVEPSFHCDYGFNIHTYGLTVINYNCVILDTSPVHIGANAFIAPGVCLACSGHAIFPTQRAEGIGTSKPITIEDDVWIGANATVCGGVTIGKGSIIGAGSVVNKDIPAGVIAVGNPCKVLREITEEDLISLSDEQP
ncbi:sugar O-acetyltransferase [Clostridium sp. P21]|uniref:Acetyltransferase n=1 Tax=Clostridium muellerianum TaxID=2716538 RepID=A0A7Y0EIK7_9CLOT|nr:sugar O-acetyltransferase [Clostridium muellerianum]NMM64138.1 sugar O-acetyltransferase [Clostridium muellerianum]